MNRTNKLIHLTHFETPLGTMVAGAVEEGVCLLEFSDRKILDKELNFFPVSQFFFSFF